MLPLGLRAGSLREAAGSCARDKQSWRPRPPSFCRGSSPLEAGRPCQSCWGNRRCRGAQDGPGQLGKTGTLRTPPPTPANPEWWVMPAGGLGPGRQVPLLLVIPTWLSGAPRKPGPGEESVSTAALLRILTWSLETLSPLPELPLGFPPTLVLRPAAVRSPKGLGVPAALEGHVADTTSPHGAPASRRHSRAGGTSASGQGSGAAPPPGFGRRTLPPPPRYPAWRPGLCPPPPTWNVDRPV